MLKAYPRHIVNLRLSIFGHVLSIILQGKFFNGPSINRFEKEFAKYIGTNYAIGVAQARLGFIAVLKALELQPEDEIILSAYNYHIIPEIIVKLGLSPVFVDIEPETYTINPFLIEEKITPKTRAIIVTHMFGQPADLNPILQIARRKGILLIEDCAHALGAEYNGKKTGSMGDIAIFSFAMGKNMPCFGGGMITVNEERLFNLLKQYIIASGFPSYKSVIRSITKATFAYLLTSTPLFTFFTFPAIRISDILGHDVKDFEKKESISTDLLTDFKKQHLRLANIQASVGIKQLAKLDYYNDKRVENAKLFVKNLEGVDSIKIPPVIPERKSSYLYYSLRVKNKNWFRRKLLERWIDVSKKSSMSDCSTLTDFKQFEAPCPVTNSIKNELLEIANNHSLGRKDIDYISRSLRDITADYPA